MADLGDVSTVIQNQRPFSSLAAGDFGDVSTETGNPLPLHSMGVAIPAWPNISKAVPGEFIGPGGTPTSIQFG